MSGQTSLPNKLICDILDIGLRAWVTPATHWASVTLVTVQTMSIQSPDLGRLGLMLLSTGQTEPDIALMSLSSQRDSNTHCETITLRHVHPGEHSRASMIRHRRSRCRSCSYDSVSPRRHSRSPSRSRGKKKKSHKKRKHSSTSSSSSRRSSSSRERERKRYKSKKKKKKHSKSRSSKCDKREKKHKRKRSPSPSPSSSSSSVSSDSSSSLQRSPDRIILGLLPG